MEITHLGHSSFKIVGKDVSIVTDPFDPGKAGLNFPKVEADIVTVSHNHSDHNYVTGVKGNPTVLDSPGEYEIKNTEIIAIDSFHDEKKGEERGHNTIFSFEVDGINICHLGDLGHLPTTEQIEKMDGVDILMCPVGGFAQIDSKTATKVISEIEPKIVIPMHYKEGNFSQFEPLDNFLKAIGTTPKTVDKLKIQKKDLPEQMEVITFK